MGLFTRRRQVAEAPWVPLYEDYEVVMGEAAEMYDERQAGEHAFLVEYQSTTVQGSAVNVWTYMFWRPDDSLGIGIRYQHAAGLAEIFTGYRNDFIDAEYSNADAALKAAIELAECFADADGNWRGLFPEIFSWDGVPS